MSKSPASEPACRTRRRIPRPLQAAHDNSDNSPFQKPLYLEIDGNGSPAGVPPRAKTKQPRLSPGRKSACAISMRKKPFLSAYVQYTIFVRIFQGRNTQKPRCFAKNRVHFLFSSARATTNRRICPLHRGCQTPTPPAPARSPCPGQKRSAPAHQTITPPPGPGQAAPCAPFSR